MDRYSSSKDELRETKVLYESRKVEELEEVRNE